MHVGEPEVAALVAEGESLVVEAEAVQDRGLQVVHMHLVPRDMKAQLVGLTVADAPLHATAGEPHREGVGVVVAAHRTAEHGAGLHHRRAAKLTAPDDERAVEHAATLEISHERGARPIGRRAVVLHVARDVGMTVPALVIDRHEPHAPLHQPPGDQAGPREARLLGLAAIEAERLGRFIGEIHQVRCRSLQPMGHLVAGDPGGDLGIAIGHEPPPVERRHHLQRVARQPPIGAVGRLHVENRWTTVTKPRARIDARQKAARPGGRAAADAPARAHHDEGRQLIALAAQAIRHPRAEARPARLGEAAVHEDLCRRMIELVGAAALHDRDIVDHRSEVRQHLRELGPALAVP